MSYFEEFYIPEPNSGCWLWVGATVPRGYGVIKVAGKNQGAHRVSWERVNGPIPKGMVVCHRCDVPGCVNPAQLFLGTQADNIRDMVQKGRCNNAGERNGRAKLTRQDILQIRTINAPGPQIARAYGVSDSRVWFIVRQKQWQL